ncbi:hypothetical protein BC829DRAFT_389713 [Chytridium lagenaria]|nr:hypothetical protein BC829DRAFT_389713 [Chytridium lagenaria]
MQASTLIRSYRSDTSLLPDATRTQSDRAAGLRPVLVVAQSEPSLTQGRKPHPLLDDAGIGDPHTYNDLLVAAETLENIVMEGIHGATAGAIRRFKGFGGRGNLTFIDTILVKTQFLVYNNQFLNHLGVVKIMFYDLMRYHFDLQKFPGVNYHSAIAPAPQAEQERAELIQDLEESVKRHGVKLAAAFARIRIERRAWGDTVQQQMENILPEDVRAKELFAVEMPKTVRINYLRTTKEDVAEELRNMGYRVKTVPPSQQQVSNRIANNVKAEFIELDEIFHDYFVIPPELFSEVKGSTAVTEGRLVFQDRASAYGIKHVASLLEKDEHVISARVGCGVTVCSLATAMKNKGKIFGFESHVDIIESDFLTSDGDDERFAQNYHRGPPSTGAAIVDKLGYLLQEEEFPNDQCSQKDLVALRRQQVNMVKHAFTFPNVKNIIYMTRATILEDVLVSSGGAWELSCVLPDIINERHHDWEIEECLKIRPSEHGNGVFLASLNRLPTEQELRAEREAAERIKEMEEAAAIAASSQTLGLSSLSLNDEKSGKRGRKLRKKQRPGSGGIGKERKGEGARRSTHSLPRLSKSLSESVNRLSVPRRRSPEPLEKEMGRSKSDAKLTRHDSKNDEEDDAFGGSDEEEVKEEVTRKRTKRRVGYGFDIGVFGISLKKFYAPQAIAIKQIEQTPDINTWRYPVPNPKPWR